MKESRHQVPGARRWVAALSLVVATGCVDKEKCGEAVRVTREALAKEQPDLARQWRERAWKICNDPSTTSTLDKEIIGKEAELAKRAADLQKQIADAAQQRMNTATAVWMGFDKLAVSERTMERLTQHQAKAASMAEGLPAEYAQQLTAYNTKEFVRRRGAVEVAAAKK